MDRIISRRKNKKLSAVGNLPLYAMAAPGLIFFLVLSYIPMVFLIISFQDFNMGKGILGSQFVGFKHFAALFKDSSFSMILANTFLINIYKIIFGFAPPLILALSLNEIKDSLLKRFMQSVVYLPHFLSWVVVSGLMISLFSVNSGFVNQILMEMGLEPVAFLTNPRLYRGYLVTSEIWKGVGWSSIIYIAALTGIDPTLYEASTIDGASKLRQIWHVSLPGIRTQILVLLILSFGGILTNSFEQVFVTINPAVYEKGEIIATYVYHQGIENFKTSYATAVGLFQSVIGFILVFSTNYTSRKLGGDSIW